MRFLRRAVIGAALAYFFHPQHGASRRAMLIGRARGLFGRVQRKSYDDATLKAKIESEVFRPADAPKGDVNVNVEHGVVYLRGQLDDRSLIDELEQKVSSVHGVERVENLLHTPS
jgi:osmotically-inducible protein OsmY